ncbi:helix-turn-helix transcriptional regulator [Listeria monocytogenes]|nr:helix-turn-helix transcriptional regulator [Listeria monocytogenes]
MSRFSDRLKQLRIERKLTQQIIADNIGVNRVTYTNWENGKREPDLDKVVELATELNTTVDYLLGNTDINRLDVTVEEVEKSTLQDKEAMITDLKKNIETIFEVGRNKFNMTDEEMKLIKLYILKNSQNDFNDK